jgi:hypothetical protein
MFATYSLLHLSALCYLLSSAPVCSYLLSVVYWLLSHVCLSCLVSAPYFYWLPPAACCSLSSRCYLLSAACWLLTLCFRTGPLIRILSFPVTDLGVGGLLNSFLSRTSVAPGADRSIGSHGVNGAGHGHDTESTVGFESLQPVER